MCGRYAFILPKEAMRNLFSVLNDIDYPPRYNIAPTQPIIGIFEGPKGRRADLIRWGYVPVWVKDPREFPLIINARSETITQKPSFRGVLSHHRCIIPASGYYEWQTQEDGSKIPYYISFRDGAPMAFAGVWSSWMGPDGEEVDSAAIVTVAAGEGMAELHDRMPAMLVPAEVDPWLDHGGVDAKQAKQMLHAVDAEKFELRQVSTLVNSVGNDSPDLIEPAKGDLPKKTVRSGQGELF